MTNLTFDSIAQVDEIVTDVIVMDLLHSSPAFFRMVLELAGEDPSSAVAGIRRSVANTSLGETDIELVVDGPVGRSGILIENKVRAPVMDRQFARYRMRGDEGIKRGQWARFRVILMSPRTYYEALELEHSQHIDANLSYEKIADFLAAHSEFAFKRHVFLSAIADHRTGYVKSADTAMMEFHHNYWLLASRDFPQLKLHKPGVVGKDSSWIYFPHLYAGARLIHKFKSIGCEIEIATRKPELLEQQLSPLLEPDMLLRPAKSTTYLNVRTPPINHLLPFPAVTSDVITSLHQLERLRLYALQPEVRQRIAASL